MNKEWLDCLMEMPLLEYSKFKESTKLNTKIDVSQKFLNTDYSGLNVIEKYLPFFKNVLESTYPFLEEVEDARKNYENRFLYTLFTRLHLFLEKQYQVLLVQEQSSNQSVLKVLGHTSLEKEEIALELQLTVTKKELEKKKNTMMSVKERLELIFEFLKPLEQSPFIEMMEGTSLVRSPIRRTELLESHEQYKKLLELSELLDNYAMIEKTIDMKEKKQETENFLIPYFMNYQLFSEEHLFMDKDEEFLKKYLEGFVRQFIEESTIDEKTFKKMINKLFEEEYAKKKNREKNIQQIFTKSIDNYQKQVKDAIRTLKG